ncbi:MAG: endonuclease MutS2 [Oscillospiraceae bacterium]|jgi:DNA mismatch repair protein MutS2|nr:endonuclease MutS2 [Oscillospiraceae bacterium]
MLEKHLKALEFDKILELLAQKAVCKEAKQRLLEIRPSTDIKEIQKLQEQTLCAQTLILRYDEPEFLLFGDISSIISRLELGAVLASKDLLCVAALLNTVWNVVGWSGNFEDMELILTKYLKELRPLKSLNETIVKAIRPGGEINNLASETLSNIRKKIADIKSQIRSELESFTRVPNVRKHLQENTVTVRNDRFVVLVKAECKGEIKGLVHDASASGSTLFVEPANVIEQNNGLKLLFAQEQREIEKVLKELSGCVYEQLGNVKNNYRLLILLDCILAKARLAIEMNAISPILVESGIIDIKGARHPLLPHKKAVPIDVGVGGNFSVLVITGPNTGGKTVALKTIGLLTVMAMSGLMLPAKENSMVSVFSHVLVDIGDEQSIEQNLSTFSGHLKNIIEILKISEKKSLVLLDELGSGTDPVEGAGLAIAIFEVIKGRGARIVATTHYAELKAYALSNEGVKNASCEFDIAALKPTYKLSMGVPGCSNAFAIARQLGFPAEIIAIAGKQLTEKNVVFENVLRELNEIKNEMQEKIEQNLVLGKKLTEECSLVEKLKEELVEKEAAMRFDFKMKTDPIVATIEDTFNEVATQIHAAQKIDNRVKLEEFRNKIKGNLSAYKKFWGEENKALKNVEEVLRKGDLVLVKNLQKEGILVDAPDKNGVVVVRIGNLTTKLNILNLRKIKRLKIEKTYTSKTVKGVSKSTKKIENEIKLLGLAVDEALFELDKFIDEASAVGLHSLRIVHGKGTGKLRAAVHNYLKSCSVVKTFRLGFFGEGENGVTIVEL